jgi:carbamoyltransferase
MEQVMINFFSKYANEDESIFYSGGVAQNVIWNTVLKNKFKKLTIAPHSADDGLSLGALEFLRRKNKLQKFKLKNFPYIQSDEAPKVSPASDMIQYAARLLSEGKVIAWYQGNGEVGPRALGNRSILMDPRIHNGKEKINAIKRRENYRPFGASVLKKHANDYFEMNYNDDYMLHVSKVKVNTLNAITHVDGTCRVQTVDENSNYIFNSLLEEFYKITGCPVLLNTSLNLAGKPIAGYPDAAKQLFVETNIDSAFIGNLCYNKN